MSSSFLLSILRATQKHGHGRAIQDKAALFCSRWKASLASYLYRGYALLRSVHAHTAHQLATKGTRADLGPSCLFLDGCWQANTRTHARAEGIKNLLANHAWADSLDLRIFLNGFDAGEEYCKGIHSLELDNPESHNAQMKQRPESRP